MNKLIIINVLIFYYVKGMVKYVILQYRNNHWIGLWVDNLCEGGHACVRPMSSECAACRRRWRWLDWSPMLEEMLSLWLTYKPDGEGRCGGIFHGGWRDSDCSWASWFICKKGTCMISIKTNVQFYS